MFLFSIACFASLGLPGASGFVAEYLTFTGAFATLPVQTILAVFGVVLTAGYLLWMLRRSFYGPLNPKWSWLTDAIGARDRDSGLADGGDSLRRHLSAADHRSRLSPVCITCSSSMQTCGSAITLSQGRRQLL